MTSVRIAVPLLAFLATLAAAPHSIPAAEGPPPAVGATEETRSGSASPPSAAAAATSSQGVKALEYREGLLSLKAEGAEVGSLLTAIGERAGVTIHVDRNVKGTVTAEFSGKDLKEALAIVLGRLDSSNFLSGYDDADAIKEVWILPKGPDPSVAEEDLRLRRFNEEDKRDLEENEGRGSLSLGVSKALGRIFGGQMWTVSAWEQFDDRVKSLGGRWSLDPEVLSSEQSAVAYGFSFLRTYENMLQTRVEGLRIEPHRTERNKGYRFVFNQYVGDVPVEGGLVAFSIAAGGFSLSNFTFSGIDVDTVPSLTPQDAVRLAEAEHKKAYDSWPSGRGAKTFEEVGDEYKRAQGVPRLVVLPLGEPEDRPARYNYHLAYEVPFWLGSYYIDAHTGGLLRTTSTILKLTGTISATVHGNNTANPEPGLRRDAP